MNWVLATALMVLSADVDTVVVCPATFREALQPWLDYRKQQNHDFRIIEPVSSPDLLRTQIRHEARQHAIKYILLVGDAEPNLGRNEQVQARSVPTILAPAKVNVLWGSEPFIATDNNYADLDDDRVPDVAIGRLPVDTPAELTRMIDRILQYERSPPPGSWQQRLSFVAGVGGFGALADSILESTTRRFLTDSIPASYLTSMTYGSWRSPFCPDPRRFHEESLARFNEGCLFWVYIGHGQRHGLDRVQTPGGEFHILDIRDAKKLDNRNGCPIALFLACYVGAFDHPHDCLAEEMLRAEGGPISVLSGSRVTMPYAMAILGDGLIREYFENKRTTLGEVFLFAKRRLAEPIAKPGNGQTDKTRQLLDALAMAISPDPELLDEERMEHISLFNLLGDPLLQIPNSQDAEIQIPASIRAGQKLTLNGAATLDGRCRVELLCRRDSHKVSLPNRTQFSSQPMALESFSQTYQQANDRRWCYAECDCRNGKFEVQLDVPREANGHCCVRVVVEAAQKCALGAANLFVHRASD